jgi:hypothetical protein
MRGLTLTQRETAISACMSPFKSYPDVMQIRMAIEYISRHQVFCPVCGEVIGGR